MLILAFETNSAAASLNCTFFRLLAYCVNPTDHRSIYLDAFNWNSRQKRSSDRIGHQPTIHVCPIKKVVNVTPLFDSWRRIYALKIVDRCSFHLRTWHEFEWDHQFVYFQIWLQMIYSGQKSEKEYTNFEIFLNSLD